jgi:DNA-binding NarL/FixJ family response regulator
MKNRPSALIVANPGPLRDSIEILLKSNFEIRYIFQAEDSETALHVAKNYNPNLAVMDFTLLNDEEHPSPLQVFKEHCIDIPSLVLVDSEEEWLLAKSGGAEIVLIKGTPATIFLSSMEDLLQRKTS